MARMRESGFLDFNHGRIYYEVDGEGPALSLIHAGVANLRQWDEQVPAFAERFRVIRYDCRTFGQTTSDNVPVSNRADLAAVLDHLEEDPTAESLEPPAVNRLREIKVPTLVMVGDLDEGGTIQACRKLATDIPGARFELFEGVAHMVNLEQPERFTRLVLDFLADAGIGQPAEATGAAALT